MFLYDFILVCNAFASAVCVAGVAAEQAEAMLHSIDSIIIAAVARHYSMYNCNITLVEDVCVEVEFFIDI